MKVQIINESGVHEALFGLGLSHGLTSGLEMRDIYADDMLRARLADIAGKLAHRGGGHNKFLRQISVWIDVEAPLYWWQEMATYGVGNTWQSESTMHTLWKRDLTEQDFENLAVTEYALDDLNDGIGLLHEHPNDSDTFLKIKRLLPSSFLQRRIMSTNYMALQNICAQRAHHRLPEWQIFCNSVSRGITYWHWIFKREGAEACLPA